MLQTGNESARQSPVFPPCCLTRSQWSSVVTNATGRETWATRRVLGMGENLLTDVLVWLGRKGFHFRALQFITAAFEGSSEFRGNPIQQKSGLCTSLRVCLA